MSLDLSVDSLDDSLGQFYLAPRLIYSNWNDHTITWKDLPEFRSIIEQTICEIYDSGNHKLANELAILYFKQINPRYEIQLMKSSKKAEEYAAQLEQFKQYCRELHERSIEEGNHVIYEAGLVKEPPPPLEPISETNYPTLWARQVYCLENGISLSPPQVHTGGFKEFWNEHKKAIIIAAVVIVVTVAVAVVIVTTSGTGTSVAVATGASAAQAAIDGYNASTGSDPKVQNLPPPPQVNEGIRNFAKTIGATDVNHGNGAITKIETKSLSSDITPEILTNLVTQWNQKLAPLPNGIKKNNFASLADHFFDGFKCRPPYPITNLIGNFDQSTIHYHCGIGNTAFDIIDGGTCLYGTLGEKFAVQPHLIHSSSVAAGLGFVALEQIEKNQAQVREIQQGFLFKENDTLMLPKLILEQSNIQKSIDYEVENLSKIAQNIIQQGNPNLKQLHVTFSNGGYIFNEALKRLPPEYRKTIIVVTTGTTAIIDRDLAYKVYNIIGDKDKGSQRCNGGLSGIEKRKGKADVDIVLQTETEKWVGGHYFMQPDYQERILKYLEDQVIGKHEIY